MPQRDASSLLRRRRPPFPLLALALASVACGVWGGMARLGWSIPDGHADFAQLHGPLMVFGFLGTVISLERAVALRRPWGFLAPLGTLAGTALLLSGVRAGIGELVLLLAGAVLVGLYGVILSEQPSRANVTLAGAAILWVAGGALWLAGRPLVEVVPWWAGFLVATIAGERLELSALGRLTELGRLAFGGATAVLVAGLLVGTADHEIGFRIVGAGFLSYAAWLARYDIARRTVRLPGLPRFVALSLLPGYAWLGVAAALWLRYGAVAFGPTHDAELHALFLGFVFSMIFGHAPVIFPGVLGIAIPYRRLFYVHLALLHIGLVMRIAGDLTASEGTARWGGLINTVAIGLFLLATLASGALASLREARRERGEKARRPLRSRA